MQITPEVKEILSWYEGDNPGVKGNLEAPDARPARRHRQSGDPAGRPGLRAWSGAQLRSNPPRTTPTICTSWRSMPACPATPRRSACCSRGRYLCRAAADDPQDEQRQQPGWRVQDQAVTATVRDALHLGCVGVGFTIYPGSDACYDMMEELRDIIAEAKSYGLAAVVWSYPRGGKVTKGPRSTWSPTPRTWRR